MSGAAACGAALKADGYGLGAAETLKVLAGAGCREFFVATWDEAKPLLPLIGEEMSLSVLHGPDEGFPAGTGVKPVINTALQARRWREAGGGACHAMLETGMNRLGLSAEDVAAGALDGLSVDAVMSHLACADEDQPMNARQHAAFAALAARIPHRRKSLANSAGICLGRDYAFDLTRPGIALYGGLPRREAEGHIRQVARIEARVVQRRRVEAGDAVGYNRGYVADAPREIAILNIGYADGYLRGFSGTGRARIGDCFAPVVGRVSMDLTAIDVGDAPGLDEGDWVELDFHLPDAAVQSGLSQYELLTTIGHRYQRQWQ